jgi:hypothetical protein
MRLRETMRQRKAMRQTNGTNGKLSVRLTDPYAPAYPYTRRKRKTMVNGKLCVRLTENYALAGNYASAES